MEANRKFWNEQQQALRQALARPEDHDRAIQLFLSQHEMVHPNPRPGTWSFDDEVWQGVDADAARCIPPGCEHSYAWIFYHLARIEDMTMNLLIANCPQLFETGGWHSQLKISPRDTGNAMTPEQIAALSAVIEIDALKAYRSDVALRTREIMQALQPGQVKQKVDPARLQRMLAEGAVVPEARGLLDYWGGLTVAGLLLMPPTRHQFVHLNEALRMHKKLRQ
jgi:hypothetical protein